MICETPPVRPSPAPIAPIDPSVPATFDTTLMDLITSGRQVSPQERKAHQRGGSYNYYGEVEHISCTCPTSGRRASVPGSLPAFRISAAAAAATSDTIMNLPGPAVSAATAQPAGNAWSLNRLLATVRDTLVFLFVSLFLVFPCLVSKWRKVL